MLRSSLQTYDVNVDDMAAAYCQIILAMRFMQERIAAAEAEPEGFLELDVKARRVVHRRPGCCPANPRYA